jgi:hypothetical protein
MPSFSTEYADSNTPRASTAAGYSSDGFAAASPVASTGDDWGDGDDDFGGNSTYIYNKFKDLSRYSNL